MKRLGYPPDMAGCVVSTIYLRDMGPRYLTIPIETFGLPWNPLGCCYRRTEQTSKGWRYDLIRNAPTESMIWSRAA